MVVTSNSFLDASINYWIKWKHLIDWKGNKIKFKFKKPGGKNKYDLTNPFELAKYSLRLEMRGKLRKEMFHKAKSWQLNWPQRKHFKREFYQQICPRNSFLPNPLLNVGAMAELAGRIFCHRQFVKGGQLWWHHRLPCRVYMTEFRPSA